ncbi:hypothetical protein BDQ12DRAFT_388837 [Crucibulum laeve]|uniref:Uncharacterized protein n=1 Tax=Crucibulum laeve TaxID=68775 RepID=A0A5C3M9J2_9AGAR|nr:hypothetical protein BDQ12DRAFT_388837 [Crucibulum laeve]
MVYLSSFCFISFYHGSPMCAYFVLFYSFLSWISNYVLSVLRSDVFRIFYSTILISTCTMTCSHLLFTYSRVVCCTTTTSEVKHMNSSILDHHYAKHMTVRRHACKV